VNASAGRLPARFWYLAGGMLVNRLGTFVLPYLAIYLTAVRGFGIGSAGVMLSAYGAGAIVSSLGGGVLADRWGRLPTMVTGLAMTAGLTALLAVATTIGAIAIIVVALGVTSDLYRPAANAVIADLVPESDRVHAYGVLYWAANLGFSASAMLGGLIASHSFTALFLIDALTSAGAATVLSAGLRGYRRRDGSTGTPPGHAASGVSAVLRDPVFLGLVALCLVFMIVYFQSAVALPVTMIHAGVSRARYGLIIAANGVTVLALQPPLTWLLRRVPPGAAMALASLLLGVGLGMLAWVHTFVLFMVAVVVWTVGEIGFSVSGPALVSRLAPDHLQGRYQGVFGMSAGVGAFVGPAAGGAVLAISGSRSLWLICLGLGAGMAVGHLALRRGYLRGTRAAESAPGVPITVAGTDLPVPCPVTPETTTKREGENAAL
jgi:MFS family permease